MTVFELCNQAITLIRGKRLILSSTERTLLESLDYEGLANAHAQDEAVVCAMNFARVRDRLQQMYPWIFCRNGTIINGTTDTVFPSGLLTMLGVFYKNEPVEYEMSATGLRFGTINANSVVFGGNATPELEIRYTRKVEDVSKWPPIFCDVFVYSLAIEICTAVTGKPEYVQLLEQKAQELIHRAHQIGAIKAETRLTLKEELYNRAIGLSRGTRSVKETSAGAVEQGLDTAGFVNDRMTAEYQACVRASDSVRDRLLGLYAWRFACRSKYLNSKTIVNNGWGFGYALPNDCVKLLSVLTADGELVDFEEVEGLVCCKEENPIIRYIAKVTDIAEWPGIFADVYCYNLAQEIIMSTTASPEIIQLLEAKAQSLIREAYRLGEIRAEVKIPAGEEIYNRAIALVRGQRIVSPSGGTAAEQGVDITGDINYREREAIAVCKRSLPEIRDKLLRLYAWKFARCTAALNQSGKKSGWNYAYTKPDDCMKVLAVLSGDEPVEYEEADGLILSNNSGSMTVRYVKAIIELSELDPVFKEVLCYELAEEISAALTWNTESISLLEQKKQQIIQNAYNTGIIQEETIIPLKEELIARAVRLSYGTRTTSPMSENATAQGIDNAGMRDVRYLQAVQAAKNSYEMVRRNLQEMYPWTFLRKTEKLTGTGSVSGWSNAYSRPSDCLAVLNVIVNDEPVYYEELGDKILCDGAGASVRYSREVEDLKNCPPMFREVFCQRLAQEVIISTTNDVNVWQLLEQKITQIVQHGYMNGQIQNETYISLKQEIYNRAISLSHGERTPKTTNEAAQSIDYAGMKNPRNIEEIRVCKRSSASVRDRLLGLYAWKFARKKAVLSTASAGAFGWKYSHELPEDCVRVLSVHSHSMPFDGEPDDFEEAGRVVYSNLSAPEIRYTARIEDMSKWGGVFADVFCYSLAEEIVLATTGNSDILQLLEAKAQHLIQNAQKLGEIRADVKIPAGEELYNRAIALVRGHRDISSTGQAASEQGIDITGDVSYREREAIAVCRRSMPELRDKLLKTYAWKFARNSVQIFPMDNKKQAGWDHAYTKNGGCMRVLAVFCGDEPVEFEEADDVILCNASGDMSMRYTKAITEISQMDAVFKEALCYELAQEISAALAWNADAISLFAQKEQALIQNAYRTGVIQEETIIPIKDELIARAVNLSYGARTVSPSSEVAVSQGMDNAGMRDSRYLSALRAAKQSYEIVRRNLQEVYPWTFLRKSAKLTPTGTISGWSNGYVRPSDCLTVLNIFVSGDPVYYEEAEGKIFCDGVGAEVRYTAEVESLNNCPPMFREVFCMKLAQEVVLATTHDMNVYQALEQKVTQTIQHGYMNGQIQNETHISSKQEMYNRAISLAHGVRTQKATSEAAAAQGIDYSGVKNPRNIEELKVCRQSVNRLRDKLLQVYPWMFARRNMTLPVMSVSMSGWSNGYTLPSDCLTVLTVIVDGEPVDYEVVGGNLYCNGANAMLRYTGRVEDMSLWSPAFFDALCYELAEEIISATTGSNEGVAVLEQKKQALIVDAYKMGVIKTETRIPARLELFNRAIGLVKGLKTEQPDILDTRYEDELSACRRCYVSVRDRLLQSYSWVFARKTETPALLSESVPGWKYTYMLPDDCLRVIAVIGKDRRADWNTDLTCRNISDYSDMVELTEYETAGRELYANRDVVYVRYTARIDDSTKWAAMFTEALVVLMAIEVALNVVGDKNIIAILEQRLSRLIEDAQMNAVIRDETRLPKQRESYRTGAVNRMYLDYSGIPTLPCGDFYGRRPCYEGGTNQLCSWGN